MDASELTALILTRDEERNLPRAITSLPPGTLAYVLDAFSSDGTVAYARAAGARVEQRAWTDYVDARRYALAQIETPWTLLLDADEALDDRLRDAIVQARGEVDGYVVHRTTYFRGKPMRMWRDEPLLRVVRTARARIEAVPAAGGSAPLHERLVCDGPTGELQGVLLHYSYPDASSYREKFARYTSLEAAGVCGRLGSVLAQGALLPVRLLNNLLRRGALFDGRRGWYVAWYSALYPAVVHWKAWRR